MLSLLSDALSLIYADREQKRRHRLLLEAQAAELRKMYDDARYPRLIDVDPAQKEM